MKKVERDTPLFFAVQQFIHTVCQSPNIRQFPGAHPVSIERKHIPLLKREPYVVCEKTDGQRYMLASLVFEGVKYCLFVNRAFDMWMVSLCIPRNTLVDGEMVGDNLYLVYDGYMVSGENIMTHNLIERLKRIETVTRAPKMKIEVRMKTMWKLQSIPDILKTHYPYKTDGLIFTPVNQPVKLETHEMMFKWKPLQEITVDFKVLKKLGKYGLYVWDRGSYVYESDFQDNPYLENKIVECRYDNGHWIFVKVREDKPMPNNRRTFFRTLVNIKEDIQPEEFYT
jgi:hypothetical protein